MDKVNGKLTVFFEEPFWVGIFERIEDGKLSVAKVTFGAEPKDYEVQEYIQKCYLSNSMGSATTNSLASRLSFVFSAASTAFQSCSRSFHSGGAIGGSNTS